MTDGHQPLSRGPAELCPPRTIAKPRLRRWEASRHLLSEHGIELAPATLAKLACLGGGPPFHKAGRVPLYPVDLLDSWAQARLGRVVTPPRRTAMPKTEGTAPRSVLRKMKHDGAAPSARAVVLVDREGMVCGIFAGPAEVRTFLRGGAA